MIRPYHPDDLHRVIETWVAASAIAHPFLSAEFQAQERQNLEHLYLPNTETWVWEEAGRVVGFVAMMGDEIGGLFVDPGAQRAGIGTALVDYVRGLRETLEVEVFKENALGRAFYDRYGFVVKEEKAHPPSGCAVLRLQLPT